jgi:hypothetical protein
MSPLIDDLTTEPPDQLNEHEACEVLDTNAHTLQRALPDNNMNQWGDL